MKTIKKSRILIALLILLLLASRTTHASVFTKLGNMGKSYTQQVYPTFVGTFVVGVVLSFMFPDKIVNNEYDYLTTDSKKKRVKRTENIWNYVFVSFNLINLLTSFVLSPLYRKLTESKPSKNKHLVVNILLLFLWSIPTFRSDYILKKQL